MKKYLLPLAMLCASCLHAQPDDLALLMDSLAAQPEKEFVTASFKNTHLINQQTLEITGKNSLDMRIQHRFGDVNSGIYNAWGVDGPANIRLGLDYSYDGRLMIGIGRSAYQKMSDLTLKYKALRQTTDNKIPLSIVLVSTMFYTAEKIPSIHGYEVYPYKTDRFSYCHQLILGRKFSERFSLQVTAMFLHYNIVPVITDKNDVAAIASAARFKLTKRFSLMAEMSHTLNRYSSTTYYDSFGLGFEVETGGHVFQVFFTNSAGIVENQFVAHTTSDVSNGGVRLGFNISRVFSL